MEPIFPLFPLQLVVFIGEPLNLHIFEPRYRQLIHESEKSGQLFGIPAFIDGKIMQVGTKMRLTRIEKTYPDGKMDVRTEGVSLFRITELYNPVPGKLYSGASIQDLPVTTRGDVVSGQQILERVRTLFDLLNIQKELPGNPEKFTTYSLAHHVGFSLEQEYNFLCITNEVERQQFMLAHLDQFIPMVKESNRLRKRVKMNGHFKNIIPPEF